MSITFSAADRNPILKQRKELKRFISSLFVAEKVSLDSLNYVFCSDEYLLRINQQFLQHDSYTDIITFDLRHTKQDPVTGEIYISVERVKENAATHNTSFGNELLRVLFHGALHLCGYKDKRKSEITIMRKTEEQYLRLYQQQINRST